MQKVKNFSKAPIFVNPAIKGDTLQYILSYGSLLHFVSPTPITTLQFKALAALNADLSQVTNAVSFCVSIVISCFLSFINLLHSFWLSFCCGSVNSVL